VIASDSPCSARLQASIYSNPQCPPKGGLYNSLLPGCSSKKSLPPAAAVFLSRSTPFSRGRALPL
jgi:hypothetical protein